MHTVLPDGQIKYSQDYHCIIQPQNGKGGIYIGNLQAAENLSTLKKHGIKAILSAMKGVPFTHPSDEIPHCLVVPGEDRVEFDLTKFFQESNCFIKKVLQITNVMVHCLAGVSRSVCLVMAYLIQHRGLTYDEAYTLIKSKREIIHPNDGFVSQLRQYELQLKTRMLPLSKPESKVQCQNSSKRRKYQYYYDNEEELQSRKLLGKNPYLVDGTISAYQTSYQTSPNKKVGGENSNYISSYASPQKKIRLQYSCKNYETKPRSTVCTPARWRLNSSTFQSKDFIPVSNHLNQTKYEYGKEIEQQQAKCTSPEKKRSSLIIRQREKSKNNQLDMNLHGRDINVNKLSNLNRLKYTLSSAELSKQLDHKIAAIRQKYSHYPKNQVTKSPRLPIQQPELRIRNYHDENDQQLSSTLNLRKNYFDYETPSSSLKLKGGQYGIGKNNLEKTLGLGKISYLREGY